MSNSSRIGFKLWSYRPNTLHTNTNSFLGSLDLKMNVKNAVLLINLRKICGNFCSQFLLENLSRSYDPSKVTEANLVTLE